MCKRYILIVQSICTKINFENYPRVFVKVINSTYKFLKGFCVCSNMSGLLVWKTETGNRKPTYLMIGRELRSDGTLGYF